MPSACLTLIRSPLVPGHSSNGALPQPNEPCSNLTRSSRPRTFKLPTLRPGLRPEGVALRAVLLKDRGDPGTFGAWLMSSPNGMGAC